MVLTEGRAADPQDIAYVAGVLGSPVFLERLKDRMHLPQSGEIGGMVDIQTLKASHQKGSAELGLTIDAKVDQPPALSGKKWVVFGWGRSGASQTDYRLEFPYDECFRAVPDVFITMQGESAYRAIEEKMRGLDRLRQGLEGELRNAREPLDYLRQKYGIFPPDNQSEAMRQVRLLEQKRMDLSVQIKAIRSGDAVTENEQELVRLYPLLHATEGKLHSANEIAKGDLAMLGEIENLQKRVKSLTDQLASVENEMVDLRRSSSNPPRITLLPVNIR